MRARNGAVGGLGLVICFNLSKQVYKASLVLDRTDFFLNLQLMESWSSAGSRGQGCAAGTTAFGLGASGVKAFGGV